MNKLIEDYIFDLKYNRHEISTNTRIKPLIIYFSFLADEYGLNSDEDVSEKHIAATNIETIRKYEQKLEKMDYSIRTIREKLIFVKSFYTYYINDPKNPISMKHPFHNFEMPKKISRDIKIFEPEYYVNFVSNIDSRLKYRNQAIATLLMTTGIKLDDLVNLKMDDIIFDSQHTPCEMTINSKPIPLNKAIKVILGKYFEHERPSIPNIESNPLFISQKLNPMHKTTVQLMLNEQAKYQNLDSETVSPITLRTVALTTYREFGGGDTGLRDFFGKNIRQIQFPTTNDEPFFDNPLINGLYDLFSND